MVNELKELRAAILRMHSFGHKQQEIADALHISRRRGTICRTTWLSAWWTPGLANSKPVSTPKEDILNNFVGFVVIWLIFVVF